ncbi:condensin complex subunit 1-like isoform X2 [Anthonomus grandis grandis]|uniref:condensin complex subunit 1-like isoform X2 n=1 Tax=Anthonomus grandis grandis TaxID=2921223 RepID=UPI002165BBA2|nr:condensin complex subunit 1-like isoform X2 [Anthonomus grandis grandis]
MYLLIQFLFSACIDFPKVKNSIRNRDSLIIKHSLQDNSSTIRNRAHLTFELPAKHEDLLTDRGGYYVKNIHEPKDIIDQFKVAKVLFKEMGVEFILKSFDVFYSVLYREESLPLDLIFQAYEHLHFATSNLYKTLNYLLADKSSLNEDLKQKYRNVIKMLIYIYLEIVSTIEKKNVNTERNDYEVRKTKKNVVPQFNLNKKGIILNLINLLETDLVIFWDPPIVEQQFINLIAELCYTFLQNPIVQKAEIFHLLGVLIKKYNYSSIFVVRIVQLIKEGKNQEHLVHCIADDIKQLIETFNCKGLFGALVRELTEWQIDAEGLQDNQSSRACSQILSALGNAMPQLIFSEIVYLDRYLGHESVSLRIAVLSIMTDLVIFLSHKRHLTKDERQCKGDIYVILTDHIRDKSPFVRSKVFQFWATLYKEHVVPIDNVFTVMKKIVDVYLFDKAPLVRKAAANCLSTFLSYNKYGSELSLSKMRKALEARQEMIKPLSPLIEKAKELKQKEYQEEWDKMLPEFKKTIYEELAKQDPEVDKLEIDRTHACEIIRTCMSHGNFADAFQLWRDVFDDYDVNVIDENDDKDKIVNEFLENYFKNIYMQGLQFLQALEDGMLQLDDCTLTLDDVKKYDVLTEQIAYYTEVIRFVELMEKGVVEMMELLESTTISDMHEAIGFFIATYRFKFDNAHIGINAMIKMVNVNDAERKEALLEALKTIYLKTDSPSGLSQHCETVVQRLIGLLRTITRATMQSFETMISEWTRRGCFDNRIINHLWKYFTGNIKVSEEEQNASLELLRCAALNRTTIVTDNIKLVVSIALKDPGPDTVNMRLMGTACHFLAVAGNERVNVTSAAPPFRIAANEPLFQQIFQIMLKYFSKPVPFYYKFMEGAIEFVYKVCARPELHVDPFLKEVSKQLHKLNAKQKGVNRFMYVRLCQILGQVAIQVLDHLDGSVYREMKRRKNIQEERKKKNKKSKKQITSETDQSRKSCTDSSPKASTSKAADETELYDEDYEDEEADYILNILENHTVSEDGILARFANILIEVAQHPREFNDETLQATAVMTLMRYMLVSSRFCREEVQLLFTILKKSDFPSVKVTILLQLADLLSRFPNIIEPWMSTIYERLRDPILDIRVAAFLTLTRLILQDTIRPHTYIHLIALTFIDENEDLVKKCHKFFTALAKKERNFIDVIPEVFGHLMDNDSVGEISDSDVKYIMKFLFGLIDKPKQMESLVEKFCDKFEQTENLRQQRHVAFCLSLIEYNDKALNKLHNHFKQYKHLAMHDEEIYASFNNILQATKKGQVGRRDLKEQVSAFEELIKSVFEMGQAGPSGISQAAPPSAKQGGANKGKGKGRKYTNSD